MVAPKQHIVSLLFIVLAINLSAQNLTGTWEGNLGTDQFLQLNIIQTGNKICGYTRDYVKRDRRSFCKAFFEGSFDQNRNILTISGKRFIERSEDHVLMNLSLNYKQGKAIEILEEKPTPFALSPRLKQLFGIEELPGYPFERGDPFQTTVSAQYVYLKKVSDQPNEMYELMKDCIEKDKKTGDTLVRMETAPEPIDSIPAASTAVVTASDSMAIPKEIDQRKNIEQSHLEVQVNTINLKVYDNAIMDGDTVSILYNGKLLLSHQLLSEKAIEINLVLDEKKTRHEITLFAENLGSIPPNTALVVITAGDKRYELFASASLEENAVLVFDYRPK